MRAPLASRTLLLAFALSIAPVVTACSGAAPPEAQPAAVEVTPVQEGLAAGAPAAKDDSSGGATGDPNGAAQTVQPTQRFTPPGTATPPPLLGVGGPDLDADGIPDHSDRCPDVPEDRDGFEDADGCPEMDNDKDGIDDMNDQCPNQPETKNGRQDADGCPD